ncbi:MAG: J domain-containing protein [Synergistaceae bacterium]|jgi:hypothetical protein|nr:J domain-containing protein [Synergistaceae bacterium]
MGSFKDYYFILGVSKTATQKEIEMAYRFNRDAMNTGSAGAFAANGNYQALMLRDIDEAYECLGNPALRRDYDIKLGAGLPPKSFLEENNPGVRAANARESIEMCFAAMKKKKSRSRPPLGRFLSALAFVASISFSAILGVGYFKTGKLTLSLDKPSPALTIPTPAPEEPPPGTGVAPSQPPKNAAPPSGQGYVKAYDIPYGGVVSAAKGECRRDPFKNSQLLVSLPRNATVLVAKETKDADGETWYFVDCNAGKGWVRGKELKVYK